MPSAPKWINNLLETVISPADGLLGSHIKVLEATFITPYVRKIRFHGNLSRMNFKIGYAIITRVSDTEFRNYTPSYIDTKKGILEIIFHLHGDAPGSNFFARLKKGDEILISMPRGISQYDPRIKHHFYFGDETSLSLAVAALPLLQKNKHQFQFYFELDDENKNTPRLLGLENYTVFPKNGSFKNEKLIQDLPLLNTQEWRDANFVLTGNVKSVQTFRRVLKDREVGGRILVKGYWMEGKKGL